jgi:hypothetical protein
MMRSSLSRTLSVCLWIGLALTTAHAEDAPRPTAARAPAGPFGSDPADPSALALEIEHRVGQKDSLFRLSPLKPLHDWVDAARKSFYEKTHFKLGSTWAHLFQGLSESLPGTDQWGTATTVGIVGTWELIHRGKPTQGNLFFKVEGRWNYGTTGPQTLGAVGLGSLANTGNTYDKYVPAFILRNIYWEQGGEEAGWAVRIGKMSPDAMFGTSRHLTPVTTFLSFAATGPFSIGLPDSGLGIAGAWYPTDRIRIMGAVTDANGLRFDWGDISEGDFFEALEFGAKLWPKTDKAGYSKVVFWHSDGTSDGQPVNGSAGPSGYGFFLLHEHELSDSGNTVLLLKYGHSLHESAFYRHQAGAALMFYAPSLLPGGLENDLFAIALTWVDPTTAGSRPEYALEIFYRFPLFPGVDTTLSYQGVIHPALDPDNDYATVISLRIRWTF